MRGAVAIAALIALGSPALAQDNIPRDPIQAEQERRIQGRGFEQLQRQNPQLYPNTPTTPAAPNWTPQYGYSGPPATALPAPQATAPRPPIPPETHLRARRPAKPPAAAPRPQPEKPQPKEPSSDE